MDSCNSGSMSSSGGDDDFDSRAADSSISAFLNHNHNPLAHIGPISNPPPPPPPDHNHHTRLSMFDPLSNYFDTLSSSSSRSPALTTNQTSLLNLDTVWSKNIRSDTDLLGLPTQQFLTNQTQPRPVFNPSTQIPQLQETVPASASGSGSSSNDHQTNTVRNPKKRSRASRRAPTTVLTTDTTNFRAMVQEFTGIPAPPFTSSPFPRSRLDLFGSTGSLRSFGSHLEPSHPSYLLRPFAQKLQPPFLPSTSSPLMSSIASASTTTTNINSSNTASNNADLGFLKYPQNLLDINLQNNPILSFNSSVQPSTTTNAQEQTTSLDMSQSNDAHLKMGGLEELALRHGNLTGLHNIVSSSNTTPRRSDHNNNSNWEDGSNEGDHHLLRSINGSYNNNSNTQRSVANNGSVDAGNTRNEGTVESWICSSG